jgi:putative FmdB family regulatory protein
MITYHYKCNSCENELETEQSIKDKPLTKCPVCGKNALERLMCGGSHVICNNISTIGQLADHNYKKNKSKIEDNIATKGKNNKKPVNKNMPATNRDIAKMTDTQKQRYIMEGRL